MMIETAKKPGKVAARRGGTKTTLGALKDAGVEMRGSLGHDKTEVTVHLDVSPADLTTDDAALAAELGIEQPTPKSHRDLLYDGFIRIRTAFWDERTAAGRRSIDSCQMTGCNGRLHSDPLLAMPTGHTLTRQLRRQAQRQTAKRARERGTAAELATGREPKRCDKCDIVQLVKLTRS